MIPPSHTIGVLGVALDKEGVLLVRTRYGAGRWQLPGGFVQPGEPLVNALRRELGEELSVDARIGSLVGLYLRLWDSNLVLVFHVSGDFSDLHVDPVEIRDASWFPHDALPAKCSPRTRRMVADAFSDRPPILVTFNSPSHRGAPTPIC